MRSWLVFVFVALLPALPLACGARTSLDVWITDATALDAHKADSPSIDVSPPVDAKPDTKPDASLDALPDTFDGGVDGPVGLLTLTAVNVSTDRVSKADQGIFPDGFADGYFAATAVGAFDALILVTTSQGQPAFGQQWDTLVMSDPVPPLGFQFTTGAQTWVLGVWENGQLANDSACRISLGAGTHTLQLVGSSSGYFNSGMEFRLYGRLGGSWLTSNVAVWP